MRKRQRLQAAQREERIERPLDGADRVLQEAEPLGRSLLSPTTAAPPTMSEWPLRYLVVECITMSKPYSIGRWI